MVGVRAFAVACWSVPVYVCLWSCRLSACKPAASADAVYTLLVSAGCLAPTPDGVDSVAKEHSSSDSPAWLDCLFAGGTVASCNVPCK